MLSWQVVSEAVTETEQLPNGPHATPPGGTQYKHFVFFGHEEETNQLMRWHDIGKRRKLGQLAQVVVSCELLEFQSN